MGTRLRFGVGPNDKRTISSTSPRGATWERWQSDCRMTRQARENAEEESRLPKDERY